MITRFLFLLSAEIVRRFSLSRSYLLNWIANYVFFTGGFLVLLYSVTLMAGGDLSIGGYWWHILGFVIWRVAGGAMNDLVVATADDAHWGTLEQVWISGNNLSRLIISRSIASVAFFSLRAFLLGVTVLLLFRIPVPPWAPGVGIIFLLTMIGPLSVAIIIVSFHLVYRNARGLGQPVATLLLFVSGCLVPVENTFLDGINNFFPLTTGVRIIRTLLIDQEMLFSVVFTPDFLLLIVVNLVYLLLGLFALSWAQRQVRIDSSLAHY